MAMTDQERQLAERDARIAMLVEIITRNTNAIMADTAMKNELLDAIKEMNTLARVPPPPITIQPRWGGVAAISAAMGSLVACLWLSAFYWVALVPR
jgi:hypothetical protein